jgi:hypothetical protein
MRACEGKRLRGGGGGGDKGAEGGVVRELARLCGGVRVVVKGLWWRCEGCGGGVRVVVEV